MKKIIQLSLTLLLLITMIPSVLFAEEDTGIRDNVKNPFTDVVPELGNTTYKAILWAYETGIVKGTSADTYSPTDHCTRAQLCVMLWRLKGKPAVNVTDNPFPDVTTALGNTTYKAILWAYQQGIVKGNADGTFNPSGDTTRANMAVMLWRTAGKPTVSAEENPFDDVSKSLGNTTYKSILWAYDVGLTKGTDKTHFSPNDPCTRAQLAVFLYRLNRLYHYITPEEPSEEEEPEPEPEPLVYKDGTELRIAAGYGSRREAIYFKDESVVGSGITLADGVTYHLNSTKPAWQQVEKDLKITAIDLFTGAGNATSEFNAWKEKLDWVDIITGSYAQLNAAGEEGKLVNLQEHLDRMPNFKAFLEENQVARLSLTANTATGAFYFSPYFDGFDDVERMPLIRADMVRELLDGDETYHGANRALNAYAYTPFFTESYTVDALTKDGSATQTIRKDYSKYGNIIAKMNEKPLTGDAAVAMLRSYIDATYGNIYAKRSDLFLGYDAAWDADEMVALLRCAVSSLNNANGDPIQGLFSRETGNLMREMDLVRFGASLFGARGLESRLEYLYLDQNQKMHDARGEAASYAAMAKMHEIYKEGLIAKEGEANSRIYLQMDAGLLSYDYSQTQTIMNSSIMDEDEEYRGILTPVSKWNDGEGTVYMRFTESYRSVKTEGWAISKLGVGDDKDKLNAALALIDHFYSPQGMITLSYGSDAFMKVKDASVTVKSWEDVAKKYETFNFNGKEMPLISDASLAEMMEMTGGNYTNYVRRYLGTQLNGYPKLQSYEACATDPKGQIGLRIYSAALAKGIVKHSGYDVSKNQFYSSVTTILPTTSDQQATLDSFTDLKGNFQWVKNGTNLFFEVIKNGYAALSEAEQSAQGLATYVNDNYHSRDYVNVRNAQWKTLMDYFAKIK